MVKIKSCPHCAVIHFRQSQKSHTTTALLWTTDKDKVSCRRRAANYTVLLRVSNRVRPFFRSIRS